MITILTDLLIEVLEVDVVVDEDAALAEGLDVDAVKGVAHQRVSVGLSQLWINQDIFRL